MAHIPDLAKSVAERNEAASTIMRWIRCWKVLRTFGLIAPLRQLEVVRLMRSRRFSLRRHLPRLTFMPRFDANAVSLRGAFTVRTNQRARRSPLTLSPRGLPGRSNHVASRDCPPFLQLAAWHPVPAAKGSLAAWHRSQTEDPRHRHPIRQYVGRGGIAWLRGGEVAAKAPTVLASSFAILVGRYFRRLTLLKVNYARSRNGRAHPDRDV